MAGIFSRLTKTLSANLNEIIDKIEDPERMIRQTIREVEANIARAKEAVVDATAYEKQIQRDLAHHRNQISRLHQEAEQAVVKGDEALAAGLLTQKKEHEQKAQNYEIGLIEAQETTRDLTARVASLENLLAETRVKRSRVMARKRSAEARHHISETTRVLKRGTEEADFFERLEDQVEDIEARAEALASIDEAQPDADSDMDRISVESDIKKEIEEMRKKLLSGEDGGK